MTEEASHVPDGSQKYCTATNVTLVSRHVWSCIQHRLLKSKIPLAALGGGSLIT